MGSDPKWSVVNPEHRHHRIKTYMWSMACFSGPQSVSTPLKPSTPWHTELVQSLRTRHARVDNPVTAEASDRRSPFRQVSTGRLSRMNLRSRLCNAIKETIDWTVGPGFAMLENLSLLIQCGPDGVSSTIHDLPIDTRPKWPCGPKGHIDGPHALNRFMR